MKKYGDFKESFDPNKGVVKTVKLLHHLRYQPLSPYECTCHAH